MLTSLNKFRTQYPEGGLVAELVSIHDGQYIVRAVASNKGIPIGSGLANSVDVQIAEDKARDRALAVLGIFADGVAPASTPSTPAPTPQKTQPAPESKTLAVSTPAKTTPPPTGAPQPIGKPASPSELTAGEEEEDLGPPIDEVREEPIAAPENAMPENVVPENVVPENVVPENVVPENKVSAAVIALESFNTSAVPVDLSDVIAQTDVELTRLGWTSDQGREYLETNYSKRSRQQLTDEELMSFLLYLEEQP